MIGLATEENHPPTEITTISAADLSFISHWVKEKVGTLHDYAVKS
jgi:hypothetical protein